jgi:hypothetical protein
MRRFLKGGLKMITSESIMSISKNDLQEASKALYTEDIPQLVEWLNLKDDNIRYRAFFLLQNRSLFCDDVYPYWILFEASCEAITPIKEVLD